MTGEPLISILMTAYNRQNYIAEAINSVLTSSFKNFEFIIIDDVSTDNTLKIARAFAEKDSRIRLYINEQNLGDYPNRNKAAEYARGVYLKYLDSDDYFLPGGLEYCVQNLMNHPEADWAMYCPSHMMTGKIIEPAASVYSHFFEKPFLSVGPGGTILKKDFFLNIGMFPTKYGPANDLYFNLVAASKGKLLLLDQEFFHYRLHKGQERNNKYSYLINLYLHLNDAVHNVDLHLNQSQKNYILNKNKRRFLTNALEYLLISGNFKKFRQAINESGYKYSDAVSGLFH